MAPPRGWARSACLGFPQVFPPSFRELPPPPLELFDLDETFSSEKARLAQITNKCEYWPVYVVSLMNFIYHKPLWLA